MKKLILTPWQGKSASWKNPPCSLLMQYRNTPCKKDGLSPAQTYLGTLYKIAYQLTAVPLHKSVKSHRKKQKGQQRQFLTNQKNRTTNMPIWYLLLEVILYPICGIVLALVSHRCHLIRTQSGQVLVRNRRFLRKWTRQLSQAPAWVLSSLMHRPELLNRTCVIVALYLVYRPSYRWLSSLIRDIYSWVIDLGSVNLQTCTSCSMITCLVLFASSGTSLAIKCLMSLRMCNNNIFTQYSKDWPTRRVGQTRNPYILSQKLLLERMQGLSRLLLSILSLLVHFFVLSSLLHL